MIRIRSFRPNPDPTSQRNRIWDRSFPKTEPRSGSATVDARQVDRGVEEAGLLRRAVHAGPQTEPGNSLQIRKFHSVYSHTYSLTN